VEERGKRKKQIQDEVAIRAMTHSLQKAIQQAILTCKMSQTELTTTL